MKERAKVEAAERERIRQEEENERKLEEANRKIEEEKEKLKAIVREKAEAEAQAKREEAERLEREKMASDDIKLVVLARNIESISLPEVRSEEAKGIIERVHALLREAVNLLTTEE